MQALVTGGGGFLGRHIVDQLLARGDTVRVLGRQAYPDLVEVGVECVQGDIADAPSVAEACRGMDAVYHVAAKAGIWGAWEDYYRPNVIGTQNVIAGCRAAGVERLIYTSTPSVVYGKMAIEGEDESKGYPDTHLTHYAATKAEAEKLVIAANDATLHTCSLRPHLIWGPGDNHLVPRLLARARAGRLRRVGDGFNRMSVCYVENGAAAHLAACDHLGADGTANGHVYFINEPEPVNCWDFINTLLVAHGAPRVTKQVSLRTAYAVGACFEAAYTLLRMRREPPMTRFLALQLATSHWFRIGKAKQDLGWTPATDIDEGIRRTVMQKG